MLTPSLSPLEIAVIAPVIRRRLRDRLRASTVPKPTTSPSRKTDASDGHQQLGARSVELINLATCNGAHRLDDFPKIVRRIARLRKRLAPMLIGSGRDNLIAYGPRAPSIVRVPDPKTSAGLQIGTVVKTFRDHEVPPAPPCYEGGPNMQPGPLRG
jgi:hypothetical protein